MYLLRAIKLYGPDAFDISVLEVCESTDDLNDREIYWIKHLNTLAPNGFNSMGGGGARLVAPEVGEKIRLALSGRINGPMSAERRAAISASKAGKKIRPPTEEHRAKISAAHKGRLVSAETREKIGLASSKRVHSPETRKRMSESHRSSEKARAHLAAMSAANTGRKLSAEHKLKIKLARWGDSQIGLDL